ncbi:MAG: response regulator transcription factor [Cyanobacteria bacterium P01_D01_bin.128]
MNVPLDASYPSVFSVYSKRILIVEDEDLIRDAVALALTDEGYEVTVAKEGTEALDALCLPTEPHRYEAKVDLAILDLMLPGIDGLDLCRLARRRDIDIPILILSAKSSETDRVVGLEVGADDYLAKPFGMGELLARCRALLRRYQASRRNEPKSVTTFEDITLFQNELRVTVGDREVNLSPKEFRILELFMQHPKRVWSREQLIEQIWGPEFMGDRKTVDVHIRWLREKIEANPSNPKYVITLRGFGYRFG